LLALSGQFDELALELTQVHRIHDHRYLLQSSTEVIPIDTSGFPEIPVTSLAQINAEPAKGVWVTEPLCLDSLRACGPRPSFLCCSRCNIATDETVACEVCSSDSFTLGSFSLGVFGDGGKSLLKCFLNSKILRVLLDKKEEEFIALGVEDPSLSFLGTGFDPKRRYNLVLTLATNKQPEGPTYNVEHLYPEGYLPGSTDGPKSRKSRK
jgi:hypothetical protein